ncbi:DUF6232 family protein [Sphingomonas aracearum]|uniref:DUF6232 family protein n=1 Tax=Sphingomonas aracearum TaxID=2283317 RepID=UPI0011C07ED1|nr:DUF6232 family protein [Sphingomonas aracearum]
MADVSIDHRFARFGQTRYATDKITSFEVTTRSTKVQGDNDKFTATFLGLTGTLFGLGLTVVGVGDRRVDLGLSGLAILAGAAWLLIKARTMQSRRSSVANVYRLMITTNAGEVAAFETTSWDEISEIESALEQAIVEARR